MKTSPAARIERLPQHFFSTLVKKAEDLKQQGADVIDLGRGSPDLPTPPHILQALFEASENPVYHRYSPFEGYPQIREGISDWYLNQRGVVIDQEKEVGVLFGSKIGLVEICTCLLESGDVCLVPDPGYPDYLSGIALAGAQAYPLKLDAKNKFLPDFELVPKEILARTKLMFLNYPGNPTATLAPKGFFTLAIEFAQRHGIIIAHDYAYGAIGFDGKQPVSFLELPGAKEVGVEFYSLSKTYNMSGWRVGFVLGNNEIVGLINRLQNHLFANIPPAIQMMAAKALTGPQDCVREIIQVYEQRRDCLIPALNKIGWPAPPPEGSFFAWLPIPEGASSMSFSDRLLKEAYVVVAPGVGFGENGEGYVRVGLLTEIPRMLEAVDRIRKLNIW
jgi:L-glutamine---4-(methylsulfanyl)-2-oxobutanoate aminotransferase